MVKEDLGRCQILHRVMHIHNKACIIFFEDVTFILFSNINSFFRGIHNVIDNHYKRAMFVLQYECYNITVLICKGVYIRIWLRGYSFPKKLFSNVIDL